MILELNFWSIPNPNPFPINYTFLPKKKSTVTIPSGKPIDHLWSSGKPINDSHLYSLLRLNQLQRRDPHLDHLRSSTSLILSDLLSRTSQHLPLIDLPLTASSSVASTPALSSSCVDADNPRGGESWENRVKIHHHPHHHHLHHHHHHHLLWVMSQIESRCITIPTTIICIITIIITRSSQEDQIVGRLHPFRDEVRCPMPDTFLLL